jgi:hypothetical protein
VSLPLDIRAKRIFTNSSIEIIGELQKVTGEQGQRIGQLELQIENLQDRNRKLNDQNGHLWCKQFFSWSSVKTKIRNRGPG